VGRWFAFVRGRALTSDVLVNSPLRLRRTPVIRNLIRETNLSRHDFVLPLFVSEKIESSRPIPSLPGVCQHSLDEISQVAADAHEMGLQAILLFGIPRTKDEKASSAYADNGVVQEAVREIKRRTP